MGASGRPHRKTPCVAYRSRQALSIRARSSSRSSQSPSFAQKPPRWSPTTSALSLSASYPGISRTFVTPASFSCSMAFSASLWCRRRPSTPSACGRRQKRVALSLCSRSLVPPYSFVIRKQPKGLDVPDGPPAVTDPESAYGNKVTSEAIVIANPRSPP